MRRNTVHWQRSTFAKLRWDTEKIGRCSKEEDTMGEGGYVVKNYGKSEYCGFLKAILSIPFASFFDPDCKTILWLGAVISHCLFVTVKVSRSQMRVQEAHNPGTIK